MSGRCGGEKIFKLFGQFWEIPQTFMPLENFLLMKKEKEKRKKAREKKKKKKKREKKKERKKERKKETNKQTNKQKSRFRKMSENFRHP